MELTKAEEQILHYLWKLEEATVQDILSCMDDAGKPSRTTVSTIIRILENKGAVSHKPGTGRGYIYYPLVKKEEYSRKQLFGFISRYFDNSFSSLASFFAKESNMTAEELDVLLEETRRKLKNEKGRSNYVDITLKNLFADHPFL